ncbi:MAG: amidohydrolase family protein [Gemmatimonadetes bacterium]|nr:amidohydrolase family protein [Gemmatimonadota bacterium]
MSANPGTRSPTPSAKRIACVVPLALCAALLAVPVRAQERVVALRGATLLTITGGTVENGVILLQGGRITAVGRDVPIPAGAEVLDLSGKTVMPGLVDASTNLGIADYPSLETDDNEATDPLTPHLRVTDALNPDNRFIAVARGSGVTAALCAPAEGNLLAGQSALIRLAGGSVEAMVVRAPVGVHVSLGEAPKAQYGRKGQAPMTRMASAAMLRQALVDAKAYGEKLALQPPPTRDAKLEALLPVVRGELPLIVGADRFDDIHTALRITAEFGVRMVLSHGAEAHRVAAELAARTIPVIWGPAGAPYQELESRGGSLETPAALAAAGVTLAFQTGSIRNVTALLDQARSVVAHGISPEQALRALTLGPAETFGVADNLGSLEVGKAADLVVFDRDPLDALARVEMVFIGGVRMPSG